MRLVNPPSRGFVQLVLFDSANTFGDFRDPVKIAKEPVDDREHYRISEIPPGEYALLVYIDENNNDRLDRNFIGIPNEPLGFANGYRPKGPPSYQRAAFILQEGASPTIDVKLDLPLGKRGRLGVGMGIIAQTSPYRDVTGGDYRAIPAIVYTGERLQIYGPRIQFGLVGSGKLRIAATGRYRFGAYEENDSDFLKGLDNRKDTFMAGIALNVELPGGVDLSTGYAHDVLDEIGGGEGNIKLDKSFQMGVFRLSPHIGLNWLSPELANHDFGVPSSNARPDRPEYELDSVVNVEGGVGMFIEINRDWLVVLTTSVEFFDRDVIDSPIVSEEYIIKGLAVINYVF
ncbi:MAG: MipA/OmpV family protein [Desulfobacterales bacterium]|nr:MipA/OmpV family protein [Desulfobacterales bacterium]MDX2510435.1 MipA/OmpV family protein [Desulfobacterales bacterium]